MSLPEIEEMAGQMIMAGVHKNQPDKKLVEMVKKGWLGGVILFPSKSDPLELRRSTDYLQSLSPQNPLFIAIDQEGGRVARLGEPFTQFPAMHWLGRTGSAQIAFEVGKVLGAELRAVGINVNFAPVLDLAINPNSKVIGDRSLGSEPDLVAELGAEIIKGIQSEGVLACAKHFPGHGATEKDSHFELPKIEINKDLLKSREIVPFKKAIDEGVKMVMVGHLLFPCLDPYHPASLSERVVGDFLKQELGFKGLVISDALEMKALDILPFIDRVYLCAKAGVDIILTAEGGERAQVIHNVLVQAVKTGALRLERIYESYLRITQLKKEWLEKFNPPPKRLISKIVGSKEHKEISQRIKAFCNTNQS